MNALWLVNARLFKPEKIQPDRLENSQIYGLESNNLQLLEIIRQVCKQQLPLISLMCIDIVWFYSSSLLAAACFTGK
jgi:hypothetical protein